LPPYRNGEEILLPTSLPLGITADAEYEESNFRPAPGDKPNRQLASSSALSALARSAGNRRKRLPMSRKPLASKTTSPCSRCSLLLHSNLNAHFYSAQAIKHWMAAPARPQVESSGRPAE
jgi:hypothetical protein